MCRGSPERVQRYVPAATSGQCAGDNSPGQRLFQTEGDKTFRAGTWQFLPERLGKPGLLVSSASPPYLLTQFFPAREPAPHPPRPFFTCLSDAQPNSCLCHKTPVSPAHRDMSICHTSVTQKVLFAHIIPAYCCSCFDLFLSSLLPKETAIRSRAKSILGIFCTLS